MMLLDPEEERITLAWERRVLKALQHSHRATAHSHSPVKTLVLASDWPHQEPSLISVQSTCDSTCDSTLKQFFFNRKRPAFLFKNNNSSSSRNPKKSIATQIAGLKPVSTFETWCYLLSPLGTTELKVSLTDIKLENHLDFDDTPI